MATLIVGISLQPKKLNKPLLNCEGRFTFPATADAPIRALTMLLPMTQVSVPPITISFSIKGREFSRTFQVPLTLTLRAEA